jgi:hypothetical protein
LASPVVGAVNERRGMKHQRRSVHKTARFTESLK